MARKRRDTRLPAPFLRHVGLREDAGMGRGGYPFDQPWLKGLDLAFTTPVTVITGENGTGKSTLIEAIAALAGYDPAGGGKGYRAVDHEDALESSGAPLAALLRAAWLPKVSDGWFFRAESFFSVARYLDAAGSDVANFLSHSHGEGFLRFFEERVARQGLYLMDEPESALSPHRLIELMTRLAEIQRTASAQVIVATHAPMLMAIPGARLLEMTRGGPVETTLRQTRHFHLLSAFAADPEGFVAAAIGGDEDALG
ncbi:MAG: AAA family ATPase [Pseudomonadota bacterium]